MNKILFRLLILLVVHASFGTSSQAQSSKSKVTPQNALQHYLHNGDTTFIMS